MRAVLALFTICCVAGAAEKTVNWTGWFSDEGCAKGRVAAGLITPTNPDCARSCIQKGAAAVFISEQAKALYRVQGYERVVDDLGWHVQVEAAVDEEAHTVTIQKVTRMDYRGASCGRPTKK